MNRRALLLLLLSIISAPALVSELRAAEPTVYTGVVSGVGAGGYDVVAYQSGTAAPGLEEWSAEHQGVTYRFSTAENGAQFVATPERYLPQFGGYCAWAVANGYTAGIDPEAWSVVGGKLYLNYSKSVRAEWSKDTAENIAKGEANWPKVLD